MNSNCLDTSLLPGKDVAGHPVRVFHPVHGCIVRFSSGANGGVLGRAEIMAAVPTRNHARPYASRASHEQEHGSSTNWQYAPLGRKACSVAPAVPGLMGEKEQYADI